MTDQPGESKPAIEFATPDPDDSDGYTPTWAAFGPIGLLFGAFTIGLAIPGTWDEFVVGYSGRRGAGIVNLLEKIGYVPTIAVVGVIAAVALSIAATSLLRRRKEN